MDPFTLFVVSALIFVAGELLRPLPQSRDRSAIPFEEARLPSTDPAKVVQKVWGRPKMSAPHLMGVTEYRTEDIEREVRTLFKSKDVTIGFRYFVGMYLGCGSGTQNLRQIWHGGVLMWDIDADGFASQSATAGDVINIDLPDFLGGPEAGGGLKGTIRWYRGDLDQVVDPYISGFPDHQPTPAYRFTCYAVFEDFEVGESPSLSEFEFVTDSAPTDYLGLGANLRIDGAETGSEVNPMAIAADLLRSTNYGQSEPASALNIPVLKAMGDTLATELNGMTLKWVNEESTERLFRTIQDQIQGTIFKKIGSGLWQGRLVRDDFDPNTIRVCDLSNVKELGNFSRRNWPETSNQAIIDWKDRALDRDPNPAVEHDFSNFRRIGRVRADRKKYPGVYSSPLAVQIAARAIKQIAFPFANGTFTGDRTFFDAEPGEPMKLVWGPLGIVSLIIRATSIGYGTSLNGDMPVSFVEDFFSQGLADFTGLDASPGAQVNTPPVAIATLLGFEMPYFLQVQDPLIIPPTAGTTTINKLAWVAQPPQANALQYRMWEESIAGQPIIASELASYTAIGQLVPILPNSTPDQIVVDVDNVTLAGRMLEDGAATEAEIKSLGFGIALIEDGTDEEFVGVTQIVDSGGGVYAVTLERGLIDTNPKTWPAATRVWFLGTGLSSTPFEHGGADVISYQGENQATTGFGPLSAVLDRTFAERATKPYPAGNFEITDTTPTTAKYPVAPLAVGDITYDWEGRDRTTGGILFQDDNGVVEAGFEYFMTIYDNTNPGTPVVLRRIGRNASGSPGTNEAVTLSGEQYVWTAAKQLVDDPTGLIAEILVELRTLGDDTTFAATIFNREDVARTFERTVVIPVLATGYRAYVETLAGLTAYWPLDEKDNAAPIVETVGAIATTRVGGAAAGSRPVVLDNGTYNASADGDQNSYYTAVDDPALDFGDTWSLCAWFAHGETNGVDWIPLVVRDGSTNRPIEVYIIGGSGLVGATIRDTSGAPLVQVVSVDAFDDGLPHQVFLTHDSTGGASPVELYVDGVLQGVSPNTDQPWNTTGPLDLLGMPAFNVSMRGILGHVQLYDVEKTSAEVRDNFLQGRRTLPFEIQSSKSIPFHWWRLNEVGIGSGATVVDWGLGGGPVSGTPTNSPTVNQPTPLEGIQAAYSRAYNFGPTANEEYVALGSGLLTGDTTGAIEFWFRTTTAANGAGFGAGNVGGARQLWLGVLGGVGGTLIFRLRVQGSINWDIRSTGAYNDGLWHHIVGVQDGVVPYLIVDGELLSVAAGTATFNGGVGGWNGTEWINDIDDLPLSYSIGAVIAASVTQEFEGDITEVKVWRDDVPTLAESVAAYAGGVKGYRTASDVLLDEDLHHLFEFPDFSAVDDVLNNMNAVTAAWQNTGGNLQLANQTPVAADDPDLSVYIPRDGNTANAVHAKFEERAFLEALGLQNFHDFGYLLQAAWEFDDAQGMVFSNVNNGLSALNIFLERNASPAGFDTQKFPPSDRGLASLAEAAERGLVVSMAYREEFISANADPDLSNGDRRILFNGREAAYGALDAVSIGDNDPTKVETYPVASGNVDDGFIAVWGGALTDDNRNFGGLLGRLAFWARAPSIFRMKVNNLRALGHQEFPLYSLALQPVLFWRMDDAAASTEVVDISGSGNTGAVVTSGTGTVTFDDPAERSDVWHQDKGVARHDGFGVSDDAYIDTTTLPVDHRSYPYTIAFAGAVPVTANLNRIGVMFGTDASGNNQQMYADATRLLISVRVAGTNDFEQVLWPVGFDPTLPHFYVAVFNAANDIDVYADGVFLANFATIQTPTVLADRFVVGATVYDGGNQANWDASTWDVMVFPVALSVGQVRDVSAHRLQPLVDEVAESFVPDGFWPLDDYEVANVYRNRIRDAAGHNIYALGTGTEVAQSAPLIPNYNPATVQFTGGVSGINSNWLGYVVAALPRSFTCWIDGGYQGTVWSMGANVDLQAVVISVNVAGDVAINIRGIANLRSYATPMAAAGPHHLVVQLVGGTLHTWQVYLDGVLQPGVVIAGNNFALATAPAFPLHIGTDITDIVTGSGNARLARCVSYPVALTGPQISALYLAGTVA